MPLLYLVAITLGVVMMVVVCCVVMQKQKQKEDNKKELERRTNEIEDYYEEPDTVKSLIDGRLAEDEELDDNEYPLITRKNLEEMEPVQNLI